MAFEMLAESCKDTNCPTFRIDPTTGTVRVTGHDPVDSGAERDVHIPGEAWARLIAQLPR